MLTVQWLHDHGFRPVHAGGSRYSRRFDEFELSATMLDDSNDFRVELWNPGLPRFTVYVVTTNSTARLRALWYGHTGTHLEHADPDTAAIALDHLEEHGTLPGDMAHVLPVLREAVAMLPGKCPECAGLLLTYDSPVMQAPLCQCATLLASRLSTSTSALDELS
jgi:hypothetical protein